MDHPFRELDEPANKHEWRFLVYDNYGSYCFFDFLQFAKEHRIVVFGLPPHTSYFLQPLDVMLFQPYKHYHRKRVLEATRTGCTDFSIIEFMAVIRSIRADTFTDYNIKAGFKKAGIWPTDVERVVALYTSTALSTRLLPSVA